MREGRNHFEKRLSPLSRSPLFPKLSSEGIDCGRAAFVPKAHSRTHPENHSRNICYSFISDVILQCKKKGLRVYGMQSLSLFHA